MKGNEMIRMTLILAVCLSLATPLVGLADDFKPDTSKTYYIDCLAAEARLSGDGRTVSQWGYTVKTLKGVETSETGDDVKWQFVAVGDKWHIQLASGGDDSRLWAVKLTDANGLALTNTDKSGGWTQFTITDAGDGKYFVTAPEGPEGFRRMKFLMDDKIGMVKASNSDVFCQVTITEVKDN